MLKAGAPSIDVERYVTTSDYGIETAGNDLVLIKLKRPAPAGWRAALVSAGVGGNARRCAAAAGAEIPLRLGPALHGWRLEAGSSEHAGVRPPVKVVVRKAGAGNARGV